MTDDERQIAAARDIQSGGKFPFDATDKWWAGNGSDPPPATDWAHAAARGIVHDLSDRRGIKHEFEGLEESVRIEIVAHMASIIREAEKGKD